ncbi:hypothetical protein B0J14DRAFT_601770 [Halenospora varia]|nr:hypothetical protein B0J14DRAFT_601770 [Halenospora varia]
MSLPSRTICRARLPQTSCQSIQHSQTRNATLLARPHRPYTFTQLDTRNHAMWQPSMDSLKNIEQDEAGRLRAFRNRFGRGWDLDAPDEDPSSSSGSALEGKEGGSAGKGEEDGYDSLMDLISGSAPVYEGEQKMITIMKDGVLTKVPDTRGSKAPKKKNYDQGWGA